MDFQVITFDDLDGQQSLPANYVGFNWSGPIKVGWNDTVGGFVEVITIDDINDPQYTGPVTISSSNPFHFIGMNIACTPSAPDNSIRLEGWRSQSKIYDGAWIPTNHYFRYHPFFYLNIDAIKIYSPHDIDYIDSITITRDLIRVPMSPGNLHVS